MHDYLFDPELVRLAVVLGIVASVVLYERFGVTAGSVIVPGYLALFLLRPVHIVATLVLALATFLLVQRRIRPSYMLWGRSLLEAELVVALALQAAWIGILYLFAPLGSDAAGMYAIGFLIPGLVASSMDKQGLRTTFWAMGLSALVVWGGLVLAEGLRDLLNLSRVLPATSLAAQTQTYAYPLDWLLAGVIVSVLLSVVLYGQGLVQLRAFDNPLRTGGFITAAYLALFLNRPADLAFVAICAGATYLIVTRFLMTRVILFGRNKLAMMFLTAFAVTWLVETLILLSGVEYVPWRGFAVIAPICIGLLSNDAERQGPLRTLAGTAISTVLVFGIVWLLRLGYSWLV